MNPVFRVQGIQLLAWLFALVELIIAFYVLALNSRHTVNRHMSGLLFFLVVYALAFGLFIGAENLEQAKFPSYLIAATSLSIGAGATIITIILLKPDMLQGRWRWVWRSLYFFTFLFPVLTLIDFIFGTTLWYTGLDIGNYAGGYLGIRYYVSPKLFPFAAIFYGYVIGLLPLVPIILALRDKQTPALTRRLAWIILAVQMAMFLMLAVLRSEFSVARTFVGMAGYALVYIFATFQQLLSERRLQRGQLRVRLTVIFLAITIPILLISVLLIGFQARALLGRMVTARLGSVAHMVVDVLDLTTDLDPEYMAELVRVAGAEVGDTGVAYIVDAEDIVIAHSDSAFKMEAEGGPVHNFMLQAPVAALRSGQGDDLVIFADHNQTRWWAYSTELERLGWVVVVQQQETVLAETRQQFMNLALLTVVVGVILLSLLGFLAVQQAFVPVISLTETARAIIEGDLSREAVIESEDEIGTLAQAFNDVTSRLNALIGDLEAHVSERTADVERRAEYLAITGGVSRAVTSILDVDTLLSRVAALISERFGFYHTGIFLVDASRTWAELRAVSSEGGRQMMARAHRLRVGEQGIVGYVSGTGRPRIALDVDEDVVWVQNPDLPETRSEMALPLVIGEDVIGVLDVQSTAAQAFGEEDVATLRILADQIAVAIRNAQLFEESQQALRELRRAYGAEMRQGWAARQSAVAGYRYTPMTVEPLTTAAVKSLPRTTDDVYVAADNKLYIPLRLSGEQTFGYLNLQRPDHQVWTQQEIAFVSAAVQDVAQALEVSRLLEQSRQAANREQLVGEVTSRVRETLNVDAVLQTAAREIEQRLGLHAVTIKLTPDEVSQ